MFDSPESYKKENLELYFRYLANAAKKVNMPVQRYPVLRIKPKRTQSKEHEQISHEIEDLVFNDDPFSLSEQRIKELEDKIEKYYTKNDFVVFETKLRRIKEKFDKIKDKIKNKDKKQQIQKIELKIEKCEMIIKRLKDKAAE